MEILQDSADSRCKFQYANKRDATKKVSTSYFKDLCVKKETLLELARVSVQGVESLFGDCRFIPADWGS